MSLSPFDFYNELKNNDIHFFTGVPDSLLKEFNNVIQQNVSSKNHIVTPNEGSAIALATGYHLSTKKIPLVYLQNSGIGNTINPILSLSSNDVYSIPMILVVGWRGQPGVKDEPQHISQGKYMETLLDSIEIPYKILPNTIEECKNIIANILTSLKTNKKPHVLLVKKNLFSKYTQLKKNISNPYLLQRHEILEKIIKKYDKEPILSTTGKSSREILHYFQENNLDKSRLFLNVGAMGHVSMIGMGVALFSNKKIICIDGDGSVIMHMGNLSSIGTLQLKNYIHIVINNGMHQSVGIQPTVGFNIDLKTIAKSCGYNSCYTITNTNEFDTVFNDIKDIDGPIFIEIRVNSKSNYNYDLPRPIITPIQRKINFMNYLE
tara:strand:+ start:393 stop:1523 length:1131 start_codon:yes stop_codon:yes gene_type:complete